MSVMSGRISSTTTNSFNPKSENKMWLDDTRQSVKYAQGHLQWHMVMEQYKYIMHTHQRHLYSLFLIAFSTR